MSRIWTSRLTLSGLYVMAMGRAFMRFRDPRRRASGKHHEAFYRRVWKEAAEKIGATHRQLNDEFAEITLDGISTRVFENVSGIDDPVTLRILHDKILTHEILESHSLPMPAYAQFSMKKMQPALAFLQSADRACVVKPAGGTGGGRGVTTGIQKASHLSRAAAAAACYADTLLIEEQLEGDNYRLLYLDGELLDSFVRRYITVTGDGKSTVRQLVHAANDERLKAGSGLSQVLIAIDLDMQRTLAAHGMALTSVPPPGQSVRLKTVINENSGSDNTTATPRLCTAVIEAGRRAVKAMGARFVGLDIITRDPGVPLEESGGAIIEANGTPNLYYHYHKSDSVFPIAEHLLRRLLIEDRVGARSPVLEGVTL